MAMKPETALSARLLSSSLSCCVSLNPTVFLRGGAPSNSLYIPELKWEPMRVCFNVWSALNFPSAIRSYNGSFLKSSLVFVIERPRYAARADAATKLPPLACFLSVSGDSNRVLNFSILSSRCLTWRSPVISISCYFCLSIYSSLCNFYSSNSFYKSSISSSYVSNLSSRSLMI